MGGKNGFVVLWASNLVITPTKCEAKRLFFSSPGGRKIMFVLRACGFTPFSPDRQGKNYLAALISSSLPRLSGLNLPFFSLRVIVQFNWNNVKPILRTHSCTEQSRWPISGTFFLTFENQTFISSHKILF